MPDEIVFAADAIATGLCGGSQFWVPGGEKVLPTNTCPLIKASVGARLDRTCPFFRIADMYVGETTCDGKKKAWEILAEDVPVHVMDLPQMKREKDVCSWADDCSGLSISMSRMVWDMDSYGEWNGQIKGIDDYYYVLQNTE